MTRFCLFFCMALSTGLLAWTYFAGGLAGLGSVLIALGLGGLAGEALHWRWVSAVGLFAFYGFAAAGFFLGMPAAVLLAAAAFVFLSWDLADFAARLRLAAPDDDVPGLERRHFLRLAAVILVGGGMGAAALSLHVRFSFEWTVILVAFGVWGIGRLIYWLVQKVQ